jgi:hypothetical protein
MIIYYRQGASQAIMMRDAKVETIRPGGERGRKQMKNGVRKDSRLKGGKAASVEEGDREIENELKGMVSGDEKEEEIIVEKIREKGGRQDTQKGKEESVGKGRKGGRAKPKEGVKTAAQGAIEVSEPAAKVTGKRKRALPTQRSVGTFSRMLTDCWL